MYKIVKTVIIIGSSKGGVTMILTILLVVVVLALVFFVSWKLDQWDEEKERRKLENGEGLVKEYSLTGDIHKPLIGKHF